LHSPVISAKTAAENKEQMSFTGDLEHLSIVDVVQLLHSTRKSGTLTVMSGKGECQLVFDDGFITSANHFDNSLRIGRILVEAKALPEEALNLTLREQEAAGENRKPLVAALIESGRVKKEDAYRGLETLLELTIVEVLTWKSGSFTLEVGKVTAADDYRYFPEKLHQKIQFHTQNVLMDALRIYDEKKRDGTLVDIELTEDLLVSDADTGADADIVISADDLGLADIEGLERRIPGVFRALEDRTVGIHRSTLDRLAPDLPTAGRERLAALLDGLPPRPPGAEPTPLFIVFYSRDDLMTYCLGTACRHEGIFVFSTNEEKDIDPVIEQRHAKGGAAVLVLDVPTAADPRFSPEALADLRRRLRTRHPHLVAVQLTGRGEFAMPVAADNDMVTVFARPLPEESPATFVEDLAAFLTVFPAKLTSYAREQRGWCLANILIDLAALRELREAPAVALALLRVVAGTCERALTLIVRGSELIPERGIGFVPEAGREPLQLAGPALKIPLGGSSLLADVIDPGGRCHWTPTADAALGLLFARVGEPLHPEALVVPLRAAGRTVSLTYADFGQREPAPVDTDLLEIIATQAGLALECILYRKRTEKAAPREDHQPINRQTEVAPWT